jgi:tRNA dimethylallyltransferase
VKRRLIAIVGPTAVGKTDIAIEYALRTGAEVISGDSMQVYRGMDIGTAKPSAAEQRGVPHHLIDIRDPDQPFSVADFQSLVDQAVAQIEGRGRPALLVGGTGLYVRAVLRAYSFKAMAGDPALRRELNRLEDEQGPGYLHGRLTAIDPVAAARLHPNDRRRLIRALEVWEREGLPISATQFARDAQPRYDYALIGLTGPRDWIYRRIDQRVDQMLEAGWVEEVRSLHSRYDWHLPALQALGYREIGLLLRGRLTYEEMRELIKRNTRRFAKRQLTWFRHEPDLRWVECSTTPRDATVEEIARIVEGNSRPV